MWTLKTRRQALLWLMHRKHADLLVRRRHAAGSNRCACWGCQCACHTRGDASVLNVTSMAAALHAGVSRVTVLVTTAYDWSATVIELTLYLSPTCPPVYCVSQTKAEDRKEQNEAQLSSQVLLRWLLTDESHLRTHTHFNVVTVDAGSSYYWAFFKRNTRA